MRALLNLFGRSPFAPLQSHMDKVAACVHSLPDLFKAIENKDYALAEQIADKISKLEHSADLTKNDIRNHLPKSLYLPIDRGRLLEILSLQDNLADAAEDAAVLTTYKQLEIPEELKGDFSEFLKQNIETFNLIQKVIMEFHDLLESSFGGVEAQRVQSMIELVAVKEHEVDMTQRKLLKHLYREEERMTFATFSLWQRIFEALAALSNLSEKLANRVRMTLELK